MIKVSSEIEEQFHEIRESGVCNMLDFHCIQREADQRGFFNMVVWMEDYIGRRDWGKVVMQGIESEED